VDLLQPASRQSRSVSLVPSQHIEHPTSLVSGTASQAAALTVNAVEIQLAIAPIPVAIEPSQPAELAFAAPAPPPANEVFSAIPAYAEAPLKPTLLATTGSAVKGLLVAARDGSDLFLPLKAALVGVVALWDMFDVSSVFVHNSTSLLQL